jgi:hypothetical protein
MTPDDDHRETIQALSHDDVLAYYGIAPGEWAEIVRDVRRGSKAFWKRRGLKEPQPFEEAQRSEWCEVVAKREAATKL